MVVMLVVVLVVVVLASTDFLLLVWCDGTLKICIRVGGSILALLSQKSLSLFWQIKRNKLTDGRKTSVVEVPMRRVVILYLIQSQMSPATLEAILLANFSAIVLAHVLGHILIRFACFRCWDIISSVVSFLSCRYHLIELTGRDWSFSAMGATWLCSSLLLL